MDNFTSNPYTIRRCSSANTARCRSYSPFQSDPDCKLHGTLCCIDARPAPGICPYGSCNRNNCALHGTERCVGSVITSVYSHIEWMKYIPSDWSLKEMCIPGTHDSAAYKMDKTSLAPWTLTQNRNFSEQLNDGIRAFDLRLSENMNFFHGPCYLSQNIYSCLDTMVSFLNAHPSEAIIITVNRENCDDRTKFNSNFLNILNLPQYKNYFYTGTYIPTLGEVRKKIVLLRRFGDVTNLGIDMTQWKDNTTFSIRDSKGLEIRVQDHYDTGYGSKHDDIISSFNCSKSDKSKMYITHFSLQSSVNSIETVANRVQSEFNQSGTRRDMGTTRYRGIYVFDFYCPFNIVCINNNFL